jgi:hypothetical protein
MNPNVILLISPINLFHFPAQKEGPILHFAFLVRRFELMRKGIYLLILASVLVLGFWTMVGSAQETVSKEDVVAKSSNLSVLSESLDKLQQQAADAKASADNAWMLMSAALVLLMTGPGLALFYGGLVRKKNVLATMMQSFSLMALVTVLWALFGYSLAFHEGNKIVPAWVTSFSAVWVRCPMRITPPRSRSRPSWSTS